MVARNNPARANVQWTTPGGGPIGRKKRLGIKRINWPWIGVARTPAQERANRSRRTCADDVLPCRWRAAEASKAVTPFARAERRHELLARDEAVLITSSLLGEEKTFGSKFIPTCSSSCIRDLQAAACERRNVLSLASELPTTRFGCERFPASRPSSLHGGVILASSGGTTSASSAARAEAGPPGMTPPCVRLGVGRFSYKNGGGLLRCFCRWLKAGSRRAFRPQALPFGTVGLT
jgi:hypothetical protein